jgi:hypothetical protein
MLWAIRACDWVETVIEASGMQRSETADMKKWSHITPSGWKRDAKKTKCIL